MAGFFGLLQFFVLFLSLLNNSRASSARPVSINITKRFDITEFGAVEGGTTVCTNAFRKAVSVAARTANLSGGYAAVVVPKGIFLSGCFSLASSVYLELSAGAELRAVGFKLGGHIHFDMSHDCGCMP